MFDDSGGVGPEAELGSMKMNQEIDAMQVMGVDPYEALVLPPISALGNATEIPAKPTPTDCGD